ncbi:hypothetical protein L7F22_014095, partial [Adiantum nelumboides]|nr:hypothetical protein [Adiantum nelumboides]
EGLSWGLRSQLGVCTGRLGKLAKLSLLESSTSGVITGHQEEEKSRQLEARKGHGEDMLLDEETEESELALKRMFDCMRKVQEAME